MGRPREGRSRKAWGGEPSMLAWAKTSRRRTAQLQRVLLKHQWWWMYLARWWGWLVAKSFGGLVRWGVNREDL